MGCCRNSVVVGEVEMERCVGDGGEGRAGLYTPRRRMNQKFEHDLVTRATFNFRIPRVESDGHCLPLSSSIVFSANSDRLSHAHIHLVLFSLHSPAKIPQCRLQSLYTSNVALWNRSSTTNSPPTVAWRLQSPVPVRMTSRARDHWSGGRI